MADKKFDLYTVFRSQTPVYVQKPQNNYEENVKFRLNKPIAKWGILYYNLEYVLHGNTCVLSAGACWNKP